LRRLERVSWALGITLTLGYGAARLIFEAARAGAVEVFRLETAALDSGSPPHRTLGPKRTVPSAAKREGAPSETIARPPQLDTVDRSLEADAADHSRRADVVDQSLGSETVDRSLWSPQRVLAFATNASNAASAARGRRSNGVLGVLRIPSLRLTVPVYEGATEINLNRGAAHIEGTAALAPRGNVGIAAHRDGFFRKLKDITIDAQVFLDTVDGPVRYRVVDIGIVQPTDVHVLADRAVPSVTLVTCYPFYFAGNAPLRYVVRAELADPQGAAHSGGSERLRQLENSRSGT
jgi:sortase A